MDSSSALDRKVAPDLGRGPEEDLVDAAAGGLEAVVGVLGGDADGEDVAVGGLAGGQKRGQKGGERKEAAKGREE